MAVPSSKCSPLIVRLVVLMLGEKSALCLNLAFALEKMRAAKLEGDDNNPSHVGVPRAGQINKNKRNIKFTWSLFLVSFVSAATR